MRPVVPLGTLRMNWINRIHTPPTVRTKSILKDITKSFPFGVYWPTPFLSRPSLLLCSCPCPIVLCGGVTKPCRPCLHVNFLPSSTPADSSDTSVFFPKLKTGVFLEELSFPLSTQTEDNPILPGPYRL